VKPLLFGAVLGVLWLVFGLPLTVPAVVVSTVVQPVTVAFVLGVLARPYLARSRRWTA
jgi:hypothetical protein